MSVPKVSLAEQGRRGMRSWVKCAAVLVICLLASACRTVAPLTAKDFSVSDGVDTITLDAPYDGFKVSRTEEPMENNYVGERFSGKSVYKYFVHQYADFDLYTSNVNYNLKNRDFNEYHISQVTLKSSSLRTPRGAAIGSTAKEVADAYGRGDKSEFRGETVLNYKMDDMRISFYIDAQVQLVTGVILTILPAGK